MSLINIRNFVSPLTNKTHLITIVVIVFAFGMYRASGGSVKLENRGVKESAPKSNRPVFIDEEEARVVTPPAAPSRPTRAPDQSDGLKDIEESLGLR